MRYLVKSISRRSSTRVAKTLLGATLVLGLLAAQVEASPNIWTEIELLGDVPVVSNNGSGLGIAAARGLLYTVRTESNYTALLSIDPASGVCTRLDAAAGVTGDPPFAKFGGSGFDAWDGKLYVFGGVLGVIDGSSIFSNDLHEFDPATRAWQQLDGAAGVKGIAPSARDRMGFSASNSSLFVTFGHGEGPDHWKYDAFRYEIRTKTWSELPSFRHGLQFPSQTVLGDTLYVFGGNRTGLSAEKQLFALQISDPVAQWMIVAVQGDVLVERENPALIRVGTKLVLFGGSASDGVNSDRRMLNDLHVYRPHENAWTQVSDAAGQAPLLSDRVDYSGSRATVIGCSMYVFGGFVTSGDTDTYSAGLFRYEVEAEGPDECKCPPGLTGPNGGVCVACGAGTYKSSTGPASCERCPSNANSPVLSIAATACTCNAGSSGAEAGGACTECAVDMYKIETGNAACTICAAGKFSGVGARSPCQPYAVGTDLQRSSARLAKTLLGDTLALGLLALQVEKSPNSWTEIALSGDVPGQRRWHGAASARGLMYVYGGQSHVDLIEIDPGTGVCTRLNAAAGVTGDFPATVEEIMMMGFTSSNSVLYVLGGRTQANRTIRLYDDFHQFDLESKAWTRLDSAANVTGTPPSARENAGLSVMGGSLIVLGGWGYSTNGNAFRYEISTKTWSDLNPPYTLWSQWDFSQAVLNHKLFIHMLQGGRKNGFWVLQLNGAESQWTEIDPGSVQGSIPSGDFSCRLAAFGGNLVQYGGYDSNSQTGVTVFHRDVHIFRPSTNTWFVATNPTGEIPEGRLYFGDLGAVDNSMFVFGGSTVAGTSRQLYRYDMPPDCSDAPSAGPCLARCNSSSIAGLCGCFAGLTGPDGGPCLQCAAGKYKIATGDAACTNCLAGQYSTTVGAASDVCQGCPTNSYGPAASNKQGSCTCNAGSSGPNGGSCSCHPGFGLDNSATCIKCIAGTYKAGQGNAPCMSCPANSNASAGSTNQTNCICNMGSTGPNGGPCTECVAGMYKSETGNAACTNCAAGKFSGAVGARGPCQPCAVGTFSNFNTTNATTSCTQCASGWTTAGEGFTMCTIYSVCDDAITTIYINTTVEVEKIVEVPVEVEKIVHKSCEADPVSNRSKDWGRPGYTHCDQPYSWRQLIHGYKENMVPVKSGGLGKLLELEGYQTWVCINDHFCGDPYFCWVYHETNKVFTPWGTNGELQLVKS